MVIDVLPHQLVSELLDLLGVLHFGLLHLVELLVELALRPHGDLVLAVLDEELLEVGSARRREDRLDELGPALEVGPRVRRNFQLPFSMKNILTSV